MKRHDILVGCLILAASASGLLALLSVALADYEHAAPMVWTAVYIAAASILALGCVGANQSVRGEVFGFIGIIASPVGFGLRVLDLWTALGGWPLRQLAVTLIVLGMFCAHACLLERARLAPRYCWVRATEACTALLGLAVVWLIWGGQYESDVIRFVERLITILIILALTGTVLAIAFEHLSRDVVIDSPHEPEDAEPEEESSGRRNSD